MLSRPISACRSLSQRLGAKGSACKPPRKLGSRKASGCNPATVRTTLTLRTRLWEAAPAALRRRIGAALVPLERFLNDRKCAQGSRQRWAHVDDTVVLGAVPYAEHLPTLKLQGVGAVINAMAEGAKYEARCHAEGLQVLRLAIPNGDTPNAAQVRRALAFIDKQMQAGTGKVYIHCNMGSGRSACLAFAYLRDIRKLTPTQAQLHLQTVRPQVHPDLWLRVPASS